LNFFYRDFFENKMSSLQMAMMEQQQKLQEQDKEAKISQY